MTATSPDPSGASPVGRVAERLGLSEGQFYTAVIGMVIGLATAAIGIPPVLRHRGLSVSAPVSPQAAGAPTAAVPEDVVAPSEPQATVATRPVPTRGVVAAPNRPAAGAASLSTVSTTAVTSQTATKAGSGTSSAASYADGGNLGEVNALATVASPGAPSGIAVDKNGAFYVATDNGAAQGEAGPSKILSYSAAGTLERSYTIAGQLQSHGRGLSAVLLDARGGLVVLDTAAARVLRIDVNSGAQTDLATLPDLPSCTLDQTAPCEPSPLNGKPLPQAAAFLPNGDLLVADAGQGVLWSVDPNGDISLWDKSMDYTSTDVGPSGVAVQSDGSVLLLISKSVTGFGGALYRIAVDKSGAHGEHTKIYSSDANSTPNGLAVGASGRIYVALTGSNSVVVLDKTGALTRTITAPALSKPFGLAFRGHSLLVTNQAPASGTVVRLPVEDAARTS